MEEVQKKKLAFTFHHICIETNVYQESINFYIRVLDFEVINESKDFHNRDFNTWLQNGNIKLELQTPKKSDKEEMVIPIIGSKGIMHIAFEVDNIYKTMNRINESGCNNLNLQNKIYEVCGNKISKLIAPEGTIIEFREKKEV